MIDMAEIKPKIFINYRRKDARGLVEKLYEHLVTLYGKENIFIDQSNIQKGKKISSSIQKTVQDCDLFLPAIGPNWDVGKNLKRLHDTVDWVRQEIELTISHKKHMLPILIDRDAMPDSQIIPGSIGDIFDLNGIELTGDTKYWEQEIRRYAKDIETFTGLAPKSKPTGADLDHKEQCIKQICYLNREKAYGQVKYQRKEGQFMFAANGSKNSGFKAFADRCSLDFLDGAELKMITWKQFEEMPNSNARRCELLDQIAKEISVNVNDLIEQDKIQELLKRFRSNKYIFYCTRYRGISTNDSKGILREWWEIWDLLGANQCNQNLIVLLFTVPSWLYRLNLHRYFSNTAKPDNLGKLGGVNKDDVIDWNEKYLTKTGYMVPEKQISKLFFMNLSKEFQDVEDMLKQSIEKK